MTLRAGNDSLTRFALCWSPCSCALMKAHYPSGRASCRTPCQTLSKADSEQSSECKALTAPSHKNCHSVAHPQRFQPFTSDLRSDWLGVSVFSVAGTVIRVPYSTVWKSGAGGSQGVSLSGGVSDQVFQLVALSGASPNPILFPYRISTTWVPLRHLFCPPCRMPT